MSAVSEKTVWRLRRTVGRPVRRRGAERPYPELDQRAAVNGAVTTMVRTLTLRDPPIRVNAIHPGLVGDSPAWAGNTAAIERARSQSPGGRIPTTADCVAATLSCSTPPA